MEISELLVIEKPYILGNPARTITDDITTFINKNNNVSHVFFQINNNTLTKIFFDLDGTSDALEDLRKLDSHFNNLHIKHLNVFSGTGFHFYVYIKPVSINTIIIANFQEEIRTKLSLDTFDKVVKGDKSRLSRIPNTINPKTCNYCITLTSKQVQTLNYLEIRKLSQFPQELTLCDGELLLLEDKEQVLNEIFDINNHTTNTHSLRKLTNDEYNFVFKMLPPCIQDWLNNYDGKSKSYKERLYLITYLKELGVNFEIVSNFIYTLLDDSKVNHVFIQEDQVARLFNKSYESGSCRSLKDTFKCSNCELYPYPAKTYINKIVK